MHTLVILALCAALVALIQTREAERHRETERKAAARVAAATRSGEAMAVELALRWRDATHADPAVARRALHRAQLLATWVDWNANDVATARLVLALPGRSALDRRLGVPEVVRDIASWRLDGAPIHAGRPLPHAAQLVGMVDFLEEWQGHDAVEIREALEGEAGRAFEPRLVQGVLGHLIELDEGSAREATVAQEAQGAVVCIHPFLPESLAPVEAAPLLRRLEEHVRERVRPADRVYATDRDVIVWLPSTEGPGTERVVERLMEATHEVVLPGRHWGPVHCRVGHAVAGADGTRLSELVAASRRRVVELSVRAVA